MFKSKDEVQAYLDDIGSDLPNVKWERLKATDGVNVYRGDGLRWMFTVCDFEIESQGFPAGSRGQDGAVSAKSHGLVIHLKRDMAKTAVESAKKQLGESR